jgi:hypothetical protein
MALRIKAGATAYSGAYGTNWGPVPAALLGIAVTVGNRNLGFAQITSPLWPKNLKPFWVKEIYLEEFSTEPIPIAPYLEPITVHMPDGSIWRTVGEKIPLERGPG